MHRKCISAKSLWDSWNTCTGQFYSPHFPYVEGTDEGPLSRICILPSVWFIVKRVVKWWGFKECSGEVMAPNRNQNGCVWGANKKSHDFLKKSLITKFVNILPLHSLKLRLLLLAMCHLFSCGCPLGDLRFRSYWYRDAVQILVI